MPLYCNFFLAQLGPCSRAVKTSMILPQDTDLNFASIAQLFSQADGPIVLVFFSAVVETELLDDERVNSDTSCTRYSSDIIPVNGLDAELIIQRQQIVASFLRQLRSRRGRQLTAPLVNS